MSPQALIIANWKMHKTIAESMDFVDELLQWKPPEGRTMLIAPSFTALAAVGKRLHRTTASEGPHIGVVAQNMHYEDHGAFTGEVSPTQVKDAGATHVIIGHSERRHLFGETNEVLNKKIHAAEDHHLVTIYCVGETSAERKAGKAKDVVQQQIEQGLAKCSKEFLRSMIIAYEPVWAIGTGVNAEPEQAEEMHAFLKELLQKETRVLYGGSVKPENAAALIAQPSIDGFLVGGASLDPDSFKKIVEA